MNIFHEELQIGENRQRRVFDEGQLADLAESIEALGLLHPVVVRETLDERYMLVAGERRLRAMQLLWESGRSFRHNGEVIPEHFVPVVLLTDLDDVSYYEAELHENLRRSDLTWQEKELALANLHKFRQSQLPNHTFTDTAAEAFDKPVSEVLNSELARVSEATLIAQHIDNPIVQNAKTKKEALKGLKQQAQAAHRAKLAAEVAVSGSRHDLYLGSAHDLLPGWPAGSFDVLITDPPYGIGADGFGEQSGTGHAYKDDKAEWDRHIKLLAVEGFRLCKDQAHAYIFCDSRNFAQAELEMTLAGWKVWPWPFIWVKNGGMLPWPELGPRHATESVLYAVKGDKPCNQIAPDWAQVPIVARPLHGAQKPSALYVNWLARSTKPGDKILDPFCGVGTAFVAANVLQLHATGCELEETTYHVAKLRLSAKDDSDCGADLLDI